MKLFNFKAFSKKTELDQKNLIDAENLEEFINDLQANKTMYHCTFDVEHRPSLVQYDGHVRPVFDTIHIDLDSKGDEGAQAWVETKALCAKLGEIGCNFHVYFSGNKGFHIAIHKSAFNITEGHISEIIPRVKNLYYSLVETYPTVDTGIWNSTRKFRAFRSQHEETGLYKIRLTGIGIKASDMSIGEIRNLALKQQNIKYEHPAPGLPIEWLVNLTNQTGLNQSSSHSHKKSRVHEMNKGETIDDDSLKFKNFADKKCVKSMMDGTVLPQFNRHDIELALMVEQRQQGKTLDEAIVVMNKWASKVYKSEPERVTDCERQVRDMYSKDMGSDKLYQFGCYGEIKSAYCSAKCKIYGNLDHKRRAEPIDCTKTQKSENEVRRNPALEKSEGQLADEIMMNMPELCKSSGQYFQWVGTHWHRIDGVMFEDSLVKVAIKMYGNQAPIKKAKALAEHVIAKINIAPETNHFFTSSPNKFNFTDCTAEMNQIDGKLVMATKPHDKKDYLSYCAPFPLKAEHSFKRGNEFKKYMETRQQDVGEEGIRIIKQMLGAALIPYVPRIFFIEGVTNAGKSTLAKLIMKLLGQENVSEVLPILRGGGADRFNWEPSIGKLANIVLELPKGAELDVNTLKMVRDKSPTSIDRKSQKHVKATLPFLHIYCCNQMPASYEGNTGALNNRVSMLFFKPGYLNGSSGIVEFADAIWADDAGGVLEAAREGLQDLIESGFHYFNGNASARATSEWQKMTDSVQLYFDEINSGEWTGPNWEGKSWEKGSLVYSDFRAWCGESGKKAMGKQTFYKDLETRLGVPRKRNAEGGERFDFANVVHKMKNNPRNQESDEKPIDVSIC